MSTTEPQIARHKLNLTEYHRMAECGILAPDARVELIEGEIVDMAPQGSAHASVVAALHERIAASVQPHAQVRCQMPVALDERSEPEPDLAIVKSRADHYRNAHPRAADVLLLVEVADKTLAYDRNIKAALYARHGVPALWIVDVAARELHCFSEPRAEGYQWRVVVQAEGEATLPPPFRTPIRLQHIL